MWVNLSNICGSISIYFLVLRKSVSETRLNQSGLSQKTFYPENMSINKKGSGKYLKKHLCSNYLRQNDLFKVSKITTKQKCIDKTWDYKWVIQNQNQILALPLIQCQILTLLPNLTLNLTLSLILVQRWWI